MAERINIPLLNTQCSTSKDTSIAEAAALIADGAQVVMSAGMNAAPMAMLRELVRQNKRNLHLIGVVGGAINLDFLVGAGCAAIVETCSVSFGTHARTAPNFRRWVERGLLRSMDSTWGVLFSQIQAGSMGVPYIPVLGLAGSDLLNDRDDMLIQPNPFHPEQRTVVAKALRPDVALLHAAAADAEGNVWIGKQTDDILLVEASRKVIVSVEQWIEQPSATLRAGSMLPALLVDAIVTAPYGAHPAAMHGCYEADALHLADYVQHATSDAAFERYLQATVFDVPDHDSYLNQFVNAPHFTEYRENVGATL